MKRIPHSASNSGVQWWLFVPWVTNSFLVRRPTLDSQSQGCFCFVVLGGVCACRILSYGVGLCLSSFLTWHDLLFRVWCNREVDLTFPWSLSRELSLLSVDGGHNTRGRQCQRVFQNDSALWLSIFGRTSRLRCYSRPRYQWIVNLLSTALEVTRLHSICGIVKRMATWNRAIQTQKMEVCRYTNTRFRLST